MTRDRRRSCRAAQDRSDGRDRGQADSNGYLVLTDSTLRGQSFYYAGRNASSVADIDRLRTAVRQSVAVVRLQREGIDRQRRERVQQHAAEDAYGADDRFGSRRIGPGGHRRRHRRRRAAVHVDHHPRSEHSPRCARGEIDARRRGRDLERQARDAARGQGARRRRRGTDAAGAWIGIGSIPLEVHHSGRPQRTWPAQRPPRRRPARRSGRGSARRHVARP